LSIIGIVICCPSQYLFVTILSKHKNKRQHNGKAAGTAAAEALAVAQRKQYYVNSRFTFNFKSSMLSGISYIIINVYVKQILVATLSKDKQ